MRPARLRSANWLSLLLVAACQAPVADEAAESALLVEASPGSVGMSAAALERIPAVLQAYVDDGRLPGIMTMVARDGHIVHWDAYP